MKKQVLLLALAATLGAAPAHAIHINDHAFVANGGDMNDIHGTAENVFDTLRTASTAARFQAVGRFGACTATWLGTEGDYAWILTAASCVPNKQLVQALPNTYDFRTDAGHVVAYGGAGSASYIHPNRLARPSGVGTVGTDIALVRLQRSIPNERLAAALGPLLYDGTAEATHPVSFVSYGSVGINTTRVLPVGGNRRVWGESIVDGGNEVGHALLAGFKAASTTHWAALAPTDRGSAWWQQHNGQWHVVATASYGTSLQSKGARLSRYASWINDLFPGARLFSEKHAPMTDTARITDTHDYVSSSFGTATVFLKAEGQPDLSAPDTLQGYSGPGGGQTWMSVPVTNADTGAVSHVSLVGHIASENCANYHVNVPVNCGNTRLFLNYQEGHNTHLENGLWKGRAIFDAKKYDGGNLVQLEKIELEIELVGAASRDTFQHEKKNLATGNTSVYFTVPTQTAAKGPTSGHRNSAEGYSTITAQGRDAITQQPATLVLRAQRQRGTCSAIAVNNAMPCGVDQSSVLKIWFDPIDNPSLAAGTRYSAKFNVQARSWGNSTVNQTFPVSVNVNLLP